MITLDLRSSLVQTLALQREISFWLGGEEFFGQNPTNCGFDTEQIWDDKTRKAQGAVLTADHVSKTAENVGREMSQLYFLT